MDPDRVWIEWRCERYLHITTIIMIENNLHAWFILIPVIISVNPCISLYMKQNWTAKEGYSMHGIILRYRDGTFHYILAPLYILIRNSAGVNQSDQQPYKLVGKMWTSVSVMGYWVYRCGIVNSWRGTFRIPLFHNKIKLIDFAIRSQFFDCMIK